MGVTLRKWANLEKKANFRSQFSYCWLSFTLLESFSFLQEFKISFKILLQYSIKRNHQNILKIICSDCYKKWVLCSIWDICWYQWLQAITNSFANLFIIFCWQIAGTKIIQFWTLTLGMTIFQAPSAHPNQAEVQTLEKTGALFTQPLWKTRPCASSQCKTVLI